MNQRFDGGSGGGGRDSGGRRFEKEPFRGGGGGGGFRPRGPYRDERRGPPRDRPQRDDRRSEDQRYDEPSGQPQGPVGETARQVALGTLLAAVSSPDFVTDHLERAFAGSNLTPQERRQAMDLTFGVVRRKATLDALLEKAVSRPRQEVERELWMLLRLGTYQLVLCDGIPDHAACDETVELAKWLGRREWVGFVNGVLRGIARMTTGESADGPSVNNVPLTSGRFRQLAAPTFSDPATKPLSYLARAFSLPMWMLERWTKRFDFAELMRLGFWFNTPSPICLRVNRLRTDREQLLARLTEQGIVARAGEQPMSIWLAADEPAEAVELTISETAADPVSGTALAGGDTDSAANPDAGFVDADAPCTETESPAASAVPLKGTGLRIDRLPGFAEGWFVVQDESAQRAAELLAPQPGEMVLDLCAAPGTKTTHMAELMRNEGQIVATDASESRLMRVLDNCRRLGFTIVKTAAVSLEGTDIPSGPFDAILIDAPCSNTGVLGKRPDARWRLQPDDLEELSRIQLRLLLAAAERLKPGGRLVYSTCSIEPEENQQVVEAACHFRPYLKLEEAHELIPGQPGDGGYQCLLRRAAAD